MITPTQLQYGQPQLSTFKPPVPSKTTTIKPSTMNTQINPPSIPVTWSKPYIPTSSLTAVFTKASHIGLNLIQFHKRTLWFPDHIIGPYLQIIPILIRRPLNLQISTTSNLPVQTLSLVRPFQPLTLNVPTSAPLSSWLQIFDDTDYRYEPKQSLKELKARTIYQLGPEVTNQDQKRLRRVRGMAWVVTSLADATSSWPDSLSEADSEDWSNFTLRFLKQLDSVRAQYKAQLEPQNSQLNTPESIFYYACCFDKLVNKGWLQYDTKMRSR